MGTETQNGHGCGSERLEGGGGLQGAGGIPNRRRGPGSSSLEAEDGRVGTLLYVQRTQRSSLGKAGPQEVLPSKKELAF